MRQPAHERSHPAISRTVDASDPQHNALEPDARPNELRVDLSGLLLRDDRMRISCKRDDGGLAHWLRVSRHLVDADGARHADPLHLPRTGRLEDIGKRVVGISHVVEWVRRQRTNKVHDAADRMFVEERQDRRAIHDVDRGEERTRVESLTQEVRHIRGSMLRHHACLSEIEQRANRMRADEAEAASDKNHAATIPYSQ